jgi:hypothetical protein
MSERISAHISYAEGCISATGKRLGIKNEPSPTVLATMKVTASHLFEPIREAWGRPIEIISFYRSKALNDAVGGSKTSQHMVGEAIDVRAMGATNAELFHFIESLKGEVAYDQIILEFPVKGEPSWLHISHTHKRANRMQVLVAVKIKGKTQYLLYKGNEKLVN